jgi:flavin-dependent dehydrogenase
MLVGAGGHFCPFARWVNQHESSDRPVPVVVAREAEYKITGADEPGPAPRAETPSLYFCPDLAGYGWYFRKESYVNVGFGRVGSKSLARATDDFVSFLVSRGIVPAMRDWPWRGHAYSLYPPLGRAVDDGVLLVGDAAGLAYAQSGEGIRPAVESGLMAADAIIGARGQFDVERLLPYERALRRRFDSGPVSRALGKLLSARAGASWTGAFLRSPRFVRHVLLDRWFLHAGQPALAAG